MSLVTLNMIDNNKEERIIKLLKDISGDLIESNHSHIIQAEIKDTEKILVESKQVEVNIVEYNHRIILGIQEAYNNINWTDFLRVHIYVRSNLYSEIKYFLSFLIGFVLINIFKGSIKDLSSNNENNDVIITYLILIGFIAGSF